MKRLFEFHGNTIDQLGKRSERFVILVENFDPQSSCLAGKVVAAAKNSPLPVGHESNSFVNPCQDLRDGVYASFNVVPVRYVQEVYPDNVIPVTLV